MKYIICWMNLATGLCGFQYDIDGDIMSFSNEDAADCFIEMIAEDGLCYWIAAKK